MEQVAHGVYGLFVFVSSQNLTVDGVFRVLSPNISEDHEQQIKIIYLLLVEDSDTRGGCLPLHACPYEALEKN